MKNIENVARLMLLAWFAASAAMADNSKLILGVWKLVQHDTQFQDGSPPRERFGQNPPGYLIFTSEGRMMAVLEVEGRKPAKTDEDRANLLRSVAAYSGIYRLEPDRWVTKVDVAWTPLIHNTEQMRFNKLDGDRLEVITPWAPDPRLPGQPVTRTVLVWDRVK
jgi:hypothetical protein